MECSRLARGAAKGAGREGRAARKHGAASRSRSLCARAQSGDGWQDAARRAAVGGLAGMGVALSAFLGGSPDAAATILRLPASENPGVFKAQRAMVQSWMIARDSFVDTSAIEGEPWEAELKQSLAKTMGEQSEQAAYEEINHMLGHLRDPYTRFVPPLDFTNFRIRSQGELHGVGLLIASEPSSGRVFVLSPIDGGPAARAGIMAGDEVVQINGKPARGLGGEQAANYLRGEEGSRVTVKLARRTEGIPGVPGRPDYRGRGPATQLRQVQLRRENVVMNPVVAEALPGPGGHKLGYIKLMSFNQRSAQEVRKAIAGLRRSGAEAFALDLRDNPGGLVDAGLEVASLFLEPNNVVLHTMVRDGPGQTVVIPEQRAPPSGEAMRDKPLFVLVNGNSASASEILAGALHDNSRAKVLGSRTFGKGKIQSVFELDNGGALFVTVALYQTPGHHVIDKVGIRPDTACGVSPRQASLADFPDEGDLESDPCVAEVEREAWGWELKA